VLNSERTPFLVRHDDADGTGGPGQSGQAGSFSRQVSPTWAEIDEARDQYVRRERRLRRWQWWFVGMFTIYATLVGVALLRLVSGQ